MKASLFLRFGVVVGIVLLGVGCTSAPSTNAAADRYSHGPVHYGVDGWYLHCDDSYRARYWEEYSRTRQ